MAKKKVSWDEVDRLYNEKYGEMDARRNQAEAQSQYNNMVEARNNTIQKQNDADRDYYARTRALMNMGANFGDNGAMSHIYQNALNNGTLNSANRTMNNVANSYADAREKKFADSRIKTELSAQSGNKNAKALTSTTTATDRLLDEATAYAKNKKYERNQKAVPTELDAIYQNARNNGSQSSANRTVSNSIDSYMANDRTDATKDELLNEVMGTNSKLSDRTSSTYNRLREIGITDDDFIAARDSSHPRHFEASQKIYENVGKNGVVSMDDFMLLDSELQRNAPRKSYIQEQYSDDPRMMEELSGLYQNVLSNRGQSEANKVLASNIDSYIENGKLDPNSKNKVMNDIIGYQDRTDLTMEESRNVIDNYENRPTYNAFERMLSPEKKQSYDETQAMYGDYREAKNEETYNKLRAAGVTDAELRALQDDSSPLHFDAMDKIYSLVENENIVSMDDLRNMSVDYFANQKIEENVRENKVGSSLFSLATNPFESAYNVGANAVNYLTGKPMKSYDSYSDIARRTAQEDMGVVGRTIYGQAMSIGDEAVSMLVNFAFPNAGPAIQGIEKASSVINEAVERGLNPNQVMAEGIASGVTTALTEKMAKGKIDNVIENGLTKYTAKEVAKFILANSTGEAIQEVEEELADYIADLVIAKDQNNFEDSYQNLIANEYEPSQAITKVFTDTMIELVNDAIGGFVGGGLFGGAGVTGAYVQGKYNTQSINTDLLASSSKAQEQLISAAEQLENHEEAKALLQKEELTQQDLIDLSLAVQEEASANPELTKAIDEINAQGAYDKTVTDYMTGNQEESIDVPKSERTGRESAIADIERFEKNAQRESAEQRRKAEAQAKNDVTANDGEVRITGIESADGGEVVVSTNKGSMNLEELTLDATSKAQVIRYSKNFENTKAAQAMLNGYKGQNVNTYNRLSKVFYEQGLIGADYESLVKSVEQNDFGIEMLRSYDPKDAHLKMMYDLGANAAPSVQAQAQLNVKEANKQTSEIIEGRELSPLYKAFANSQPINIKNMNETEVNGFFRATLGQIGVSIASGNEYAALTHEIGEMVLAYNPKGMKNFQKAVVEYMTSAKGAEYLNEQINRYKEAYRNAGRKAKAGSSLSQEANKTYDEALDEYVNDFISGMLMSDEGIKDFVNHVIKSESFTEEEKTETIKTFGDFINHLIKTISNYIKKHTKTQAGSSDALEAEVEKLKELRKLLFETYDEAVANIEAQSFEQAVEDIPVSESFSLSVPIEKTDNLVALHNLSESKLLKTLELGGFPMPSIAITKAEYNPGDFGEITALFSRMTVDPSYKGNKVYSGDAWTPMFPTIQYKPNEKAIIEIRNKIIDILGGPDVARQVGLNGIDATNLEDQLNRWGTDYLSIFGRNEAVKYAYLKDVGKAFDIPMTTKKLSSMTENTTIKEIAEKVGADVIREAARGGSAYFNEHPELSELFRKSLNEGFAKKHPTFKGKEFYKEDDWGFGTYDRLLRSIKDYVENGFQETVDSLEFGKLLDENVDESGYSEWLNNQFSNVVEKKGIRNKKELFTNSGNRRTFEQLHDEITLENVVNNMLQDKETGEAALFAANSIFGAATRPYKSIEELNSDKARLKKLSDDEIKALRTAYQGKLSDIAGRMIKGSSDSFMALNGAIEEIVDCVAKSKTAKSLTNKLNGLKQWYNIDEQIIQDVIDLVADIAKMPTTYFEAKPQRAVSFDEVAMMFIPTDSSQELIKALNERGIPYTEYEAGNNDARVEAINGFDEQENISFSVDVDPEYVVDQNGTTIFEKYKFSKSQVKTKAKYEQEVKNIVLDMLKKLPKESIVIKSTGDVVYIGDDFGGEYIGSKDTYSRNDKNLQAKMSASAGAMSIIENAKPYSGPGKPWTPNVEEKHNIDAKRGWMKYDISFGFKNEAGGVTYFSGIMKVRMDENGNDYVYDFINIEKQQGTRTPLKAIGKSPVASPTDNISNGRSNVKHSIDLDSTGKKLTEEQQTYFEKSVIRDSEGRLKVMYHGTTAEFTVFDRKYAKSGGHYGRGFYFSDTPLAGYSSGIVLETYLNITNPISSVNPQRVFTKEQLTKYVQEIADNDDYGIENYGYGATVKSIVSEMMKKKTDFEILADLNITCIGDFVEAVKLFNEINGTNYDGIEVETETVAFYPNQIKDVTNENPTENDDRRFSVDVDPFFEAFEEIDSQQKAEEEQIYSMIKQGLESGSFANEIVSENIARKIKKQYGSKISIKKLSSDIRAVFSYLRDTGNIKMEDVMRTMREVAQPVIEAIEDTDPAQKALYDEFTNTVKSYTISLDNGQMQEVKNAFGSLYEFKRATGGIIKIDNKAGNSLDSIWSELCDASGGMLSFGTNPNEQPVRLAELINGLKPTARILENSDIETEATNLALEIFRQFFVEQSKVDVAAKIKDQMVERSDRLRVRYKNKLNEALKEVEAEKAINLERLASEIDSLTAEQQEAIQNGDILNQAYLENMKQKYIDRYNKLKAQSNDKIARARAEYRNAWINKNLRREQTELKARLQKEVKALQNMLAHPQKGSSQHIPVGLVNATIQMLEAINLDNGGRNKAIVERLKKMSEVYDRYKNDPQFAVDYDERTAENIKELQEIFEGKSYADLQISELSAVLSIIDALKTQIKNANNLILQDKLRDAQEVSQSAIEEVKDSRVFDNAFITQLNRYTGTHLNAYREFRRLSGYTDGAMMELYKDLDDGSRKQMQIEKDLGAIFSEVLEGSENQKEVKKLISTKDLVDIGITDSKGNPVMVTRAMRLSLIMHSMNDGNMRHILGSGITVPNMYYFAKGDMEQAYSKGQTYRFVDYTALLDAIQSNNTAKIEQLTQDARQKIEALKENLSEWEKEFLKCAEKMFHDETGKLINDTSMKLKGYAIARVKNYFPIRTDSHFTNQEWAGLVRDGSLEGMGMLKERKIASNPILLEDITSVIQRQTSSVAKYAGLAIPIRNFEMAIHQTTTDQTTGKLENLSSVIDSVWGASDTKWLKNMLQDLQGGRAEKSDLMMRLRGQFAGATLTLNPSVAIKQTASYPTAAAVVGYKALGRAMLDSGKGFFAQKGIEELEKINPLLWYRNQGYGTQELADAKASGFGKNLPQWAQKAIGWTQWFDTGTVRTLEYAAKYYVDDNFKELEKGSEEYWQKVSEIFSKVVEETQPNYSTLQKADIIRDPNSFKKMLVMFKTQPLQNFGIIYDAAGELAATGRRYKANKSEADKKAKNEAGVKFARAVSSQVASAAIFSGMTILSQLILHKWNKFRDDDDKWNWIEAAKTFGLGILSNFAGAFLGGSELFDFIKSVVTKDTYYGTEISVVEMVNDTFNNLKSLIDNIDKAKEAVTSEDKENVAKTYVKTVNNLALTISEYFGIPAKNIENMFFSGFYYAKDVSEAIESGEMFRPSSDYNPIYSWKPEKQYRRIYNSFIEGDMDSYNKYVEEQMAAGKTEDDIATQFSKMLKEDYLSGTFNEEEAMNYLESYGMAGTAYDKYAEEQMAAGLPEDEISERYSNMLKEEAYIKVGKWESEAADIEAGLGDEDISYGMYSKVNLEIQKCLDDPNGSRAAMVDSINTMLGFGKKKNNIRDGIKKKYAEQYKEALEMNRAADMHSVLLQALTTAGYSTSEAKDILKKWAE